MKRAFIPAFVSVLLVAASLPAGVTDTKTTSEKGAKALFVDSFSGAEIPAGTGGKPPANKIPPKKVATGSVSRSVSTGLMYWVELLKSSGEAVRVTSDQVFHSGDRIRVHLTGSVDGDVAVYQRDPQGQAVRLFPDMRVNAGSARVRKGTSTIVPSASSWFRFDDKVGTERLLIVLTPQMQAAPTAASATVVASAESNPDRRYDELRPAEGSKGLILETDTSSAQPATYVVRSSVSEKPLEPISVEIVLRHER